MKSRNSARYTGALPLSAILLILAGCGRSASMDTRQPAQASPAVAVQLVTLERKLVHEVLDLSAKIQPDPSKLVRIFPPASGRVLSIMVKPGDVVRRGETLASMQSGDVGTARAEYAKAEIETNRSTRAMERTKSLYEHGAASEKDYIEAHAAAESARAELERTRQRLSLLNVSPEAGTDHVRLTTPTDGVVLEVSAAPGEFAKSLESASPLITLADLSSVWIVAELYEKDVEKVKSGQHVTVTLQAYPGRQWKGRIASISGALDPATRTLKVRVILPNPGRELKPEMFGLVHADTGTHEALLVPATAVLREGDRTSVFVQKNGKTEQRAVMLGATVGRDIEVISGVQPGEHVVSQGAELLKGSRQ